MTSQAQSITVNGKRFVSGLFWQPLTRPRSYLQEAREIGRREKMDVVAIRKGRVLQAGFARKSTTVAGGYSLASTLAGALGEDWIGVFEVDGQYVIVGTKNGAIIPGCDAIGAREDIEDRLRSDFNLHRFGRVFCPQAFGFGGEERDLRQILGAVKLRREYRLTALSARERVYKTVLAAVGVFALCGLLVVGVLHRRATALARKEAAARVLKAKHQAQKAQAAVVSAPAPVPHSWATEPLAKDLRVACVGAIDAVPVSMGGWTVDSIDCNGSTLQLASKRAGEATNATLRQAASAYGYQVESIDATGETAELSKSLPVLPVGGDEALASMDTVVDGIRAILRRRDIAFSLTPKLPPAPPAAAPGKHAPPAPAPDWKTNLLTVNGPNAPAVVMAGIEEQPGMRLTTIGVKRTGSTLDWTLTGEINGK